MKEKTVAVLAVLVMLLPGAAHMAYGYWTDWIAVREDIAVVWPVEVEIQETEENTDFLPDTEAGTAMDGAERAEAGTAMDGAEKTEAETAVDGAEKTEVGDDSV